MSQHCRSQREDAGGLYSTDMQYTPVAAPPDTTSFELPPAKKLKCHDTTIDTDIMVQDDTTTSYAMQDSAPKTCDSSEAGTSYNYFASFPPKESTETTPTSHPADQGTEILRLTPGRSKSLQPFYDSPPPTEPFSSLVSPHQKRSKSDLADRNSSQKSPSAVQDEHHSSVEAEITTTKKKRGRPKKQAVNEGAEVHLKEIPDSAVNSEGPPNKRRPGRPRKVDVTNKGNDGDPGDAEDTTTVIANQGNGHQDVINENNVLNHDGEGSNQFGSNERSDLPPRFSPDDLDPGLPAEMYKPRPSRSRATTSEDHSVLNTTEEPEKVKKKKIKRGKTTSAVLSKSYESDVEADVLWIEDGPVNKTSKEEGSESNPIELDGHTVEKDAGEDATATREDQNARSGGSASLPPTEASGPEPQKRGRKRKKTNQEPVATELPSGVGPAQEANEDHVKPAPKNVLQDISNLPSPTKSEDKKPKRNQMIESPEVVIAGDRQENDHGGDDNPNTNTTYNNNNTIQSSPHKSNSTPTSPDPLLETPKKTKQLNNNNDITSPERKTPNNNNAPGSATAIIKGPDKHSPIARTSKVPFRVGLSRKARIAPLLKVVRK